MLNDLELYREAGTRAATARNQGDERAARFEYEFKNRLIRNECLDDRPFAQQAYDAAYSNARRT